MINETENEYYKSIIEELSFIERDVTDREAAFIQDMIVKMSAIEWKLTSKQKTIIDKMKELYFA